MSIRITHLKLASGEDSPEIAYEEFNDTSRKWDKHGKSQFSEPALDSLVEALSALKPLVPRYREEIKPSTPAATRDELLEKYSVTGINFYYGSTDVPGESAAYKVIIAAHKKLEAWGPANCNTPRLPVVCEDPDAPVLKDGERQLIESVHAEAVRYLCGERKQSVFDFEDDSDPDLFDGAQSDTEDEAEDFEVVGGGEEVQNGV